MSNNSNNNLRSAMRLYQENGDPITSLRECQKVWNSSAVAAMKDNTEGGASSTMKQQWPIPRQHNEAILQNLAAQRQRSRKVRPRPSSFDADSSSADDNNNDNAADEKGDEQPQRPSATTTATTAGANNNQEETDLITLLNNMLTLSIQQHQNSTTGRGDDSQQQQLDNDQKVQLLITSYNLSLSHYAHGNYTRALQVLGGVFLHWMDSVSIVTNTNTTTTNNNGKKVDKKDGSGGKSSNSRGKEGDGGDKQQQQMIVQFNYNDNNSTTIHHLPLNSTHVKSILAILTRIAFLLLDCLLNVHVGDGRGVAKDSLLEETLLWDESENGDKVKSVVLRVQDVLKWVENVILVYAKQRTKHSSSGDEDDEGGMMVSVGENNNNNDDVLKPDEVKFKLHLYKSRVLLQGTRDGSSKMTQDGETRARLARKELKNAMDIYQNKLCVVEDGNSSSSEGKGGGGGDGNEKGKNKGGGGKGADKQRGGKGNSTNNHHHHQQDTSETTSISGSLVTSASDGLWNEGKGGVVARATFEGMPNNKPKQPEQQQQQQQQSPPQKAAAASSTPSTTVKVKVKKDIPGLHVRHESALYMKANLEYLRGNTTKSLKLCAEARTAGRKSRAEEAKNINGGGGQSEENGFGHNNDDDAAANGNKTEAATEEEDVETQMAHDYDEAIYYNNLAMVHQSAGKIHVALHYYSYAISYMENVQLPNDKYFWSDGVARPNVTADILNNVSLCAFQAHDYKRAYECMARCVTLSPSILGGRARCWLRMAQSLIGRLCFPEFCWHFCFENVSHSVLLS
jgi:tetratricopeptide (TPR) repeat protein